MTDIIIISVACASGDEAERIAAQVIEQRLAACAQAHPIRSTYRWQGRVETSDEVMLTLKTTLACWAALEATIRAIHSYEVPEILAVRAEFISAKYADWVRESVDPPLREGRGEA